MEVLFDQLEQVRDHLGAAVEVVHDEHFVGAVDASLWDVDPSRRQVAPSFAFKDATIGIEAPSRM